MNGPAALQNSNKRPYRLPRRSELPGEFIRLDPWEGEYLFLLASRSTVGILETGRFRGGSTFLLASANGKVPIFSVDIAPQDDDGLLAFLRDHHLGDNLRLIVGDSQHTKYPQVGELDLLFIDGDHSYEGCTADLTNWYPSVVPGGHILLHDSYLGSAVQDAVIDFASAHEVDIVRSPYINAIHWHHPTGSLAHLVRR